jgi:hypothetical protein
MKNAMIAVLLAGLTLVSGVSAMEMMDSGSMMKDDKMMMSGSMDKTMMKDTMKMDDKMMMAKDTMTMKSYNRMSTAALAKSMGYTWRTDRAMLATQAGIVGYRGTKTQNLAIRAYLMGMMKDKMMMADDKMMAK